MCNLSVGIIEKARQESKLETLCSGVKNIMESFNVTVDDAMKVLKVSKEDQAILRKMI